jgi:signal transduction histidine kinase
LLLGLGALAPIFLRRSRPGAALALAVAVQAALPDNRVLVLPVMAVLFTIAGRTPWKTAGAAGAAAAAAAIIAGAVLGSGVVTDHGGLLGYAIGSAASYAAAVALGLYVGARRRVLEGLRERAERLDRERELLADRAVAQERTRIAQELHDIVAHNVSLMVVEAQALGATVDDDRVTRSTDAIAGLGRQAMAEMHTTLKLLRGDGETPELAPQPGLAQLERLVEQLRRAGLEIELTVEGKPRLLAQGVDLSAYRIIQEALTNVVKHATGASTEVTLAYKPQALELTIVDTGDKAIPRLPEEPSEGHGVIGMRERAALFGGRLTTELLPHGFKVTATLPYAPTPS